jgi:glycerate kinase
MQYLTLDRLLEDADLVITAEGRIDFQTPRGKIPAEVARRAKSHQLPVIALVGTIGEDAEINFHHGIDSFESILDAPCSLGEAIANAPELVTKAAARVTRSILVGQKLRG